MLLAAMQPGRIVAAVLNDVGPELDPAGMQRIRGLVGAGGSQPTWLHAARQIGEANALIFPNYTVHDWLRMVKRTHRLTPEGRIVADYDKQIAAPFRAPVDLAGQDLWPAFAGMKEVPMVLVRGALSDILPSAVARRMRDEARKLSIVEIADVGHAPTLDEPEAVAAIDALLSAL
jgi:pimeloyl-ACP methyl ester carboxylesterase